MKVHETVEDLNKIEPRMFLIHSLYCFEVVEQLSAWTIVKDKTDKIVCFETVVHLYNERMIQHRVYHFLVLDDVFLLVFRDELFQHYFHRVKLSITQASNQINFAEPTDGQTLADLVLFKSSLSYVLYTVEGSFLCQNSLANRNLVIQYQILIHRLKTNDLGCFK